MIHIGYIILAKAVIPITITILVAGFLTYIYVNSVDNLYIQLFGGVALYLLSIIVFCKLFKVPDIIVICDIIRGFKERK